MHSSSQAVLPASKSYITCIPLWHLLWYVLCHDGVEAVEEVGPGHAEGDKGEEELRPAALGAVAKVTGLAVERDHLLHVVGRLLSTTLVEVGELACVSVCVRT